MFFQRRWSTLSLSPSLSPSRTRSFSKSGEFHDRAARAALFACHSIAVANRPRARTRTPCTLSLAIEKEEEEEAKPGKGTRTLFNQVRLVSWQVRRTLKYRPSASTFVRPLRRRSPGNARKRETNRRRRRGKGDRARQEMEATRPADVARRSEERKGVTM